MAITENGAGLIESRYGSRVCRCQTERMSNVVQAIALPDLPSARDFIVSPGFAGALAVVAAVIVLGAVLYGSRRARKRAVDERELRERHHEELREDERRAVAVARCWDRWWQVQQTAAIEPAASEGASLGLGPEVTLELLRGLLREAEQLGEDALAKVVAVYQEQFLLVLAQQSGPLSRLAAAAASAPEANGRSGESLLQGDPMSVTEGSEPGGLGSELGQRHGSGATTGRDAESVTTEASSAAEEGTSGRRRRR